MKVCPSCQETYSGQASFCPKDGSELEDQPESEDPFIGQVIADRYQVLERLGSGAFATVYRVRDTVLEDVEALKVFDRRRLPPERAREAIERFKREARVLRRLGKRSQHIVGVTNTYVGREGGTCYAMEFVDGLNLAEIIVRDGAMEFDVAVDLTKQLCDALEIAHSEGVIHRDLKLQNLMVTREGQGAGLRILDFGIAKIMGESSLTNLELGAPGTPGFASPEQLENPGNIDHRSDLFSVGVVLYALLTARDPWLGRMVIEPDEPSWPLIRASLERDPQRPTQHRKDLPAALDQVLTKLLEKRPGERYESAAALREALAQVQREPVAPEVGSLRVESDPDGVAFDLFAGRRKLLSGKTPNGRAGPCRSVNTPSRSPRRGSNPCDGR